MKFTLFLMCTFLTTEGAGRSNSFELSLLPRPHDNEFFEIYYLQSAPFPLDSTSDAFHMKRSGLAIRSSRSEKVVVMEYRPVDITSCFLPVISKMKLTTDVLWDKHATVELSREIDSSLWPTSVYLTRVNSVVYWQYMKWVNGYAAAHPIFIPQSICLSGDENNCAYKTQNWDTFIADSFVQLSEYAVSITPFVPLKREEWVVHVVGSPQEFIYAEGLDEYYSHITTCVSGKSDMVLVEALGECLANSTSLINPSERSGSEGVSTAVVFLHYSENVYLKLTATLDKSTSAASPSVMVSRELDIPLPPPHSMQLEKQETSDYVILGAIVGVMGIGLSAGLWKVGFLQRMCCQPGKSLSSKGKAKKFRRASQWDSLPHSADDEEEDEEGEGGEVSEYVSDMDSASHGFDSSSSSLPRGSSPDQAMGIGVDTVGGTSRKSKSQLLHETLMHAATGRGVHSKKQEAQYSQLRIDEDEDDML